MISLNMRKFETTHFQEILKKFFLAENPLIPGYQLLRPLKNQFHLHSKN